MVVPCYRRIKMVVTRMCIRLYGIVDEVFKKLRSAPNSVLFLFRVTCKRR